MYFCSQLLHLTSHHDKIMPKQHNGLHILLVLFSNTMTCCQLLYLKVQNTLRECNAIPLTNSYLETRHSLNLNST